jgi:hypothetical protein
LRTAAQYLVRSVTVVVKEDVAFSVLILRYPEENGHSRLLGFGLYATPESIQKASRLMLARQRPLPGANFGGTLSIAFVVRGDAPHGGSLPVWFIGVRLIAQTT